MKFIQTLITGVIFSLLSFNISAQVYFDDAALMKSNGTMFGIGIFGGANQSDMEFGLNGHGNQYGVNVNIAPIRFLQLNLDYTMGNLKGGPVTVNDLGKQTNVTFESDFTSYGGSIRFMPLRLFMWDQMDPWAERFTYIYGALGIASIHNKTTATQLLDKDFGSVGTFDGKSSVFVQELGIDIPCISFKNKKQLGYNSKKSNKELILNFNYKFHKTNNDLIDAFKPIVTANQHNDVFSSYSAGLMFRF